MPSPELRAQLGALAAHVRDPSAHAGPPGIEARRLKIYADLVFNNLRSLFAGNFPVLKRCVGEEAFSAAVRSFLRDHRAQTPLFPEVAREFIEFLAAHDDLLPPWALELAHYEHAEVALTFSTEHAPADASDVDVMNGRPQRSPLAWPLLYAWPVHRLSPEAIPASRPEAPTCLLLQRDVSTQRVRFSELTPLALRLLQRIDEEPQDSGRAHMRALAQEAQARDIDTFVADGALLLSDLRARGAIVMWPPL